MFSRKNRFVIIPLVVVRFTTVFVCLHDVQWLLRFVILTFGASIDKWRDVLWQFCSVIWRYEAASLPPSLPFSLFISLSLSLFIFPCLLFMYLSVFSYSRFFTRLVCLWPFFLLILQFHRHWRARRRLPLISGARQKNFCNLVMVLWTNYKL